MLAEEWSCPIRRTGCMVSCGCYEKQSWSLGMGKELTSILDLEPLMGSKASSFLSNVWLWNESPWLTHKSQRGVTITLDLGSCCSAAHWIVLPASVCCRGVIPRHWKWIWPYHQYTITTIQKVNCSSWKLSPRKKTTLANVTKSRKSSMTQEIFLKNLQKSYLTHSLLPFTALYSHSVA